MEFDERIVDGVNRMVNGCRRQALKSRKYRGTESTEGERAARGQGPFAGTAQRVLGTKDS